MVRALDKLSSDLLNTNRDRPAREERAVRGDRADGQGLREPAPARAAGPARTGAADRRGLARASEQSTANTSQHLQALHTAGMVTRAREGTKVRYSLAGDQALTLWLALRDASVTQLAEVERAAREYLGEDVEAIGRDELIARFGRGDVVLIDVRPGEGIRGRPHRRRALDPARRAARNDWPSCPPTARSRPIAADRSAPTRTKPYAGSAPPGAPRDGSTKAGRSGDSPSSPRHHPERHVRSGGDMRAIDCPCGHHFEAADTYDIELVA